MKKKLSITVEEDILEQVESALSNRVFRNKSHVVEYALMKLFEEGS
jgi:Arc/MetJ-type ribon-helix-helix transcriptional regulator